MIWMESNKTEHGLVSSLLKEPGGVEEEEVEARKCGFGFVFSVVGSWMYGWPVSCRVRYLKIFPWAHRFN